MKQVIVIAPKQSLTVANLVSGMRDALRAAGLSDDKQFKLSVQIAGTENSGDLPSYLQKVIATKPDVIVALTAPVAIAARDQESGIPIIFGDVYDVDAASLTAVSKTGVRQLTGVVSSVALNRQVELIRTLAPAAKRIGVLYRAGAASSVALVKQLTEALSKFGLVLIESSVTRSQDVGSAARSMISKVDVFFSIDDPTVSQAYPALVKAAIDAKLPLIASQAEAVNQGALAGLEFNQREVGQQMGRMLVKVLRGQSVSSIAPETIARPTLWLNQATARKLELSLPEAILNSANQIILE